MQQPEPLNSIHSINLFKKIILYLNVAAFRVNNSTSNRLRSNRDIWITPIVIASITDYFFIKYVIQLPAVYRWQVFIGCIIFHGAIELLFSKSIVIMAYNFNAYYNKYLFYLYIALIVFAIGGGLIIFNNNIGHVAPGTHWHYHGF